MVRAGGSGASSAGIGVSAMRNNCSPTNRLPSRQYMISVASGAPGTNDNRRTPHRLCVINSQASRYAGSFASRLISPPASRGTSSCASVSSLESCIRSARKLGDRRHHHHRFIERNRPAFPPLDKSEEVVVKRREWDSFLSKDHAKPALTSGHRPRSHQPPADSTPAASPQHPGRNLPHQPQPPRPVGPSRYRLPSAAGPVRPLSACRP